MSKAAKRNFLFLDGETKQTSEILLNGQNATQSIHSLKSPHKHKRKNSETLKEKFKSFEFIEHKTLEVYFSVLTIHLNLEIDMFLLIVSFTRTKIRSHD
jgi:hypothetical protein